MSLFGSLAGDDKKKGKDKKSDDHDDHGLGRRISGIFSSKDDKTKRRASFIGSALPRPDPSTLLPALNVTPPAGESLSRATSNKLQKPPSTDST